MKKTTENYWDLKLKLENLIKMRHSQNLALINYV